ncbi:hypothetical protein [uncultured Granulicatella sp.]|uniref:hypothetical protein n=1 Tax=uncultured Granulicatella sp. TaxID=316089 RepID=UPI0028D60414|nr:hypothetical protein [uncultured Granulicatella sp.]
MSITEFLNGEFPAAIISGIVAFIALSTAYRRSLDLESEWRKTLFKAAGSEEITMEEVQLLRTALRYGKVDDAKVKIYSFFWFTNLVIDFCDHLRKKKKSFFKNRYLLTEAEQEVIRIFIRCLLKHNWEVNENLKAKLLRRRIDETKYMKESYEKACEEYKVMKNGIFDFKKYIENQGENKEKKEMKEEKGQRDIWSKFQFIIQGAKMLSFILLIGVLILRVLCELLKCDVNISNETMGFAIIIALMFFFLKE